MSDVTPQIVYITTDETQFTDTVSESLMNNLAGSNNYIASHQAQRPVGSVIQSVLDEPTFQSVAGTNWVLADGRHFPGSTWQTLMGTDQIPDMRALYTRGGNNNRSDAFANPVGNQPTTTVNSDEFKTHNHTATYVQSGASVPCDIWRAPSGDNGIVSDGEPGSTTFRQRQSYDDIFFAVSPYTPSVTVPHVAGVNNGAETNPWTTVVNSFIRIN